MKLRYLGLVFLTILIFGCLEGNNERTAKTNVSSQQEPAGISYGYYSSPAFLIYYPRSWHVNDTENGVFRFTAPPDSTEDQTLEGILVEVWVGNESTPAEFMNYEKRFILNEEDIITKNQSIRFKGRDAYEIDLESTDSDTGTITLYRTIFFRNGRAIYRINTAIEKKMNEKYGPIMDSILEKFVIGNYGT